MKKTFNSFNFLVNFIFVSVAVMFVIMLSFYGFVAYKGYEVLTDTNTPQAIGQTIGEVIKGMNSVSEK
jgi:hypothetical protein